MKILAGIGFTLQDSGDSVLAEQTHDFKFPSTKGLSIAPFPESSGMETSSMSSSGTPNQVARGRKNQEG